MENKMGKGVDFDFAIYNADTEEGASDLSRGWSGDGDGSKIRGTEEQRSVFSPKFELSFSRLPLRCSVSSRSRPSLPRSRHQPIAEVLI